ncbi:MAG: nickel-dependent hydrogenase large subunit, partial [Thermoproteota archaeon]
MFSITGCHAASALEAKVIADAMVGGINGGNSWLDQLQPNQSAYVEHTIPRTKRSGYGLTEAPRGALGHWMKIGRGRITHYQAVIPTTWNGSPAWGSSTAKANRGAAEQAVMDTPVHATDTSAKILNIIRCIHSFDFCGACAIHLNTPNGKIKVAIDPDGKVVKTEV